MLVGSVVVGIISALIFFVAYKCNKLGLLYEKKPFMSYLIYVLIGLVGSVAYHELSWLAGLETLINTGDHSMALVRGLIVGILQSFIFPVLVRTFPNK